MRMRAAHLEHFWNRARDPKTARQAEHAREQPAKDGYRIEERDPTGIKKCVVQWRHARFVYLALACLTGLTSLTAFTSLRVTELMVTGPSNPECNTAEAARDRGTSARGILTRPI